MGGIANLAAGLIGNAAASGNQSQANSELIDSYNQILATGVPPNMAQQILLQQYQAAGTLTPALEAQINAAPSQVAQIQANQQAVNAQTGALQQLQQVAQGGQTPQEQAQMIQGQLAASQQAQAKNAQILQGMQAQGVGGSGAQLAAQLSASQGGANQAAASGLQAASNNAQNAQAAMSAVGQLGNTIQNTQFGEAQTKAAAADALNRFNVQNQINTQAQNVQAQNQAQAYNLQNQQQLENQNTSQANQEAQRELQGQMQTYQDTLGLNQTKAAAMQGQAGGYQNEANQTQALWNGIGSGASQIIGMPGYAQGGKIPQAWEAGDHNGPAGYADGGQVASDSPPDVDPQKAKQFEQGFNSPDADPSNWWENLKKGLSMAPQANNYAKGGVVTPEKKVSMKKEKSPLEMAQAIAAKSAAGPGAKAASHEHRAKQDQLAKLAMAQHMPPQPMPPQAIPQQAPMAPRGYAAGGAVAPNAPMVGASAQGGPMLQSGLPPAVGLQMYQPPAQPASSGLGNMTPDQLQQVLAMLKSSQAPAAPSPAPAPATPQTSDENDYKGGRAGHHLDTNARHHIAHKNFALPGERYPIEDKVHARNALARISQHGTEAEKEKVRAAVHRKYPGIEQGYAFGGQISTSGEQATGIMPSSGGGNPTSGLSSLSQLAPLAAAMKDGGKVPGKPPVPHKDTPKNDIVSAKLTPGELVIPLSHASSEAKAKQFVTKWFKKEQGK